MQGDIVKAAKWLGGCMVVASLVLVIGLHPTVTGRMVTFTKVQPEPVQSPTVPNPSVSPAYSTTGIAPAGNGLPQAFPCVPAVIPGEPELTGRVPSN